MVTAPNRVTMRKIDPNDPAYRGLTKSELRGLKLFSKEEKELLSQQLFGVRLDEPLQKDLTWQEQRDQRWNALLQGQELSTPAYKWRGPELIQRTERLEELGYKPAVRVSKEKRTRTVSAFADWVMRLYIPENDPIALQRGIEGERAVVDRQGMLRRTKLEIPRWEFGGWKLEHDGIRGQFMDAFDISTLKIGGEGLQGVPDLVFRERRTNRIAIVEIKVSSADLPSDGWPNLRAQLWAYSRIDRWMNAPEIILAGEVWAPVSAGLVRRATYRWVKGENGLEEECAALFTKYGGTIER
jgi:hypothetical protein